MPTKAQNEAAELKEAQAARMIALKQAAKKKEAHSSRKMFYSVDSPSQTKGTSR